MPQNPSTGLQLHDIKLGTTSILCDTSTSIHRLVLPKSWTCPVFDLLHRLSHDDPSPTQRAICKRYVWHNMKQGIQQWYKECHPCQAFKIHWYTKAPLTERPQPSGRFCSLHVDLVGHLPESHGMTYVFPVIDRFSRWPEAIPILYAQAVTCAEALIHHWISTFRVQEEISSDDGRQFTSTIWTEFNKVLDIKAHQTTAYHPQANRIVKRFHQQLKSALKAYTTSPNWLAEQPLVGSLTMALVSECLFNWLFSLVKAGTEITKRHYPLIK